MLDRNSKTFFTYFFLAILLSIGITYYTIVIKGDYRTYTLEDDVPAPTDVYYNIVDYFQSIGS